MSFSVSFRPLVLGAVLSLAMAVSPAQAHHNHRADIVVPLAALIAIGALYNHGHHRHSTHRHYYHSYKKRHRHHHGYGHSHKRRSYSQGGYHRYKH